MPDLSPICDLCCSLKKCWIHNPLSYEARDWTHILVDTNWVLNTLSHNRNFGSFKISVWISVLRIVLFICSITAWFSLGRLHLCKILPIFSRLSIFWHIIAYSSLLWSLVFLQFQLYLFFGLYWFEPSPFFLLRSLANGLSIFFLSFWYIQIYLSPICLILLLFLLPWETDLRKHWYNCFSFVLF